MKKVKNKRLKFWVKKIKNYFVFQKIRACALGGEFFLVTSKNAEKKSYLIGLKSISL